MGIAKERQIGEMYKEQFLNLDWRLELYEPPIKVLERELSYQRRMSAKEKPKRLKRLSLNNRPDRLLSWEEVRRVLKMQRQGKIDVRSWKDLENTFKDQGWSLLHVHKRI